MATILELVQAACYEGNIAAPSTLVGSTLDLSTLQLVHLTYATGRELRAARVWPQLKRVHQFTLENGRTAYRLPVDFYATLPGTEYTRTHSEPMVPLSDAQWNYRLYGHGMSCIGREFRIFGPDAADSGQFHVSPTPGTSDAGTMLSYEYITANWLVPGTWPVYEAGSVVTKDQLISANGNVYRASEAGAMGSVAPSVNGQGIGSDGNMLWQYIEISMWEPSHAYAIGDHVQNPSGGGYYVAIDPGTSAATGDGPSGPGTIPDGSVIWSSFTTIDAFPWTAEISYSAGDYVGTGYFYYRAVKSGVSGPNRPHWAPTTDPVIGPTFRQPDSNSPTVMNWYYQSTHPNPYTKILADTDISLFDDELMIAGLKWRFLRARGLEYRDLELEYQMHKDAAVSRYQPQMKISLSDGPGGYYYPRVPDGSWVL